MNNPLACPVCFTSYNLAQGSICPDCRVKLRAIRPMPIGQLTRIFILAGFSKDDAIKHAIRVLKIQ